MQKLKALLVTSIVWFVWVYSVYHARASNNTIDVDLEKNTDTTKDCQETRKQLVLPSWWKLNDQCRSQKYVTLTWETNKDRMMELIMKMWHSQSTAEQWTQTSIVMERMHKIKKEMFVCIPYADSNMGISQKSWTTNNVGNVFHFDRWWSKSFTTLESGIDAIARYALNGKPLWLKKTIDQLTPATWEPWPYYATSPINWHNNTYNCLNMLYWKDVWTWFVFRVN